MTQEEALEREFKDLIDYVQKASAAPEQGLKIDSATLAQKTEKLCRIAETAAPKTAAKLKPLMAALIDELDNLAAKLEIQTAKGRK